jgi:peptide/nickel transport system substrate-binding protein
MVKTALLCVILVLAGCESPAPDAIVFAVATAPQLLDPRLAGDAASERVNALLYAPLVELDAQGRPQPHMGSWQQLQPRRYRVTLDPDRATFTTGVQPNATDVAATYRSVLQPTLGSPHASALQHIAEIRVHDDVTVDFDLARPDPQFASRLTIGILPERLAADHSAVRDVVGSGTFAFVDRFNDGSVVLERRRDAQRVRFMPTPDPTMRVLKLLRGEAHLLQNDLPSELYRYLSDVDDVALTARSGTTFAYLGFNLADPVLARRDIRLAIAHAIDREAIARYLFNARAAPAESVLRPGHWAGTPHLQGYRHDPALARQLLAAVGYSAARPLRLSYKTSTDPFRLRIAHVFQQQLADVGIVLTINSYDWGTFFGDIKAGRFQLYSLAWVGVNTPDILRYAFHSESQPPGGANRGRYLDAEVDALIERAEQLSPSEAVPHYQAVQRRIHADLVYVPLWYESNVAVSRGLRGYTPAFDGSYLALNNVEFADVRP